MEFKDKGVLELGMESPAAAKQLDELNAKAKELKKTLSEVEKSEGKDSDRFKTMKKELDDTTKAAEAAAKALKSMDLSKMTLGQLETHVKDLNKELKGLVPGTNAFIDATKRLQDAQTRLTGVRNEVKGIQTSSEELGKPTLWNKITGGIGTVGAAFKALMALQIIGYIIEIGRSIFETTANFEKYGKILTNTLQSEQKAKETMSALKNLAAQLPQTLEELTEGYIKLANRGLRPSQDDMKRLTDFAQKSGLGIKQLSEAIMDINNQDRWSEFGVKIKTSGDKIITTIGGVQRSFDKTEEGALQMAIAMGKVPGTMGLAASQMDSLSGISSNLTDNFDALKVEIGDRLRPVFVGLLSLANGAISVFRVLVNVISTIVSAAVSSYEAMKITVTGGLALFSKLGEAAGAIMKGNFADAAKLWGESKKIATDTTTALQKNAQDTVKNIANIWSDKTASNNAELAGKEQGSKYQKQLTEEQKKALSERNEKEAKAKQEINDKVKQLSIDAITDEKTREIAKLDWKFEKEKTAIEQSKAAQGDKAKAIEQLEAAHKAALTQLQSKFDAEEAANRQKALEMLAELSTAASTDEKKRKEDEAKFKYEKEKDRVDKEIKDEQLKSQIMTALGNKLTADLTKINDEYRKKEETANKFVRDTEQKAWEAYYDWAELTNKNNGDKLTEIKKQRLDRELAYKKEKLNEEQKADEEKAKAETQNQDQLTRALQAIHDKYRNEEGKLNEEYRQKQKQAEEEQQKQRIERRKNLSDAFASLLKGDVDGFLDGMAKMVEGEKKAWQERLSKNQASYNAYADMAKSAVNFINQLTQNKLQKEIAAAETEKKNKIKLLDEQLKAGLISRDKYEESKLKIEKEGDDQSRALKKRAWEAQKKADIASAIIDGAKAALKALASAMFPVNIAFAAIVAGLTAAQVIKIKNQPAPEFAKGGFIARGGSHGSRYGEAGIALVDRRSGRETGEIEGDEAVIVSKKQTRANWGLIQRMFRNARTPGKESEPVSAPMGYRDGGLFESPYWQKRMYYVGGTYAKDDAEASARNQEEEQGGGSSGGGGGGGSDSGGGSSDGGSGGGWGGDTTSGSSGDDGSAEEAKRQAEEAQKMMQAQLDLLTKILEVGENSSKQLGLIYLANGMTKVSVDAVVHSTNKVEQAIYQTDSRNSISQLIYAISSLKSTSSSP